MKRVATAFAALILLSAPVQGVTAAYANPTKPTVRIQGASPPERPAVSPAAVPSATAPPAENAPTPEVAPLSELAAPTLPTRPHAPDEIPDFGAADKVVAAYKAHTITDDDLVRFGTQWLIGDPGLPERFRAAEPLGDRSASYQAFLATKVDNVSPQTRAWLATVFAGERTAARTGAKSATVAATAPAAAGLPDDPNNECGLDVKFLLESYECRYRTDKIRIYYNIGTLGQPADQHEPRKVPALFTRKSDTPDGILQIVQASEKAFATYRDKLGMQISLTADPMPIYIGARTVESAGTALAWPFDGIGEGNGNPVIMMPSDFGTGRNQPRTQYNYLTRHEIFHAFQYHYIPNASLLWNQAATNWWMEATAEWATHKSYENEPDYDGVPGEDTYYARNADLFFGTPELSVHTHAGLGGSRQYSANPFVTYLTERTTPDFVRLTWEAYAALDNATGIGAIRKVLADREVDPAALMLDFAIANYRLAPADTIYTDGYVHVPGYADQHAATVWRNNLATSRKYATNADAYGPARPAHQTRELAWSVGTGTERTDLHAGGAMYVDIVPKDIRSSPEDRGLVKVHVDPDPGLRYKLVSWRRAGSPNAAYPTVDELIGFDAKGDATARVNHAGTMFTLVVVRTDLPVEPSDAEASIAPVFWNATLTPDVATRLTIEGEPGTATPQTTAQHNWFVFDAAPGQRFYLSGSTPEWATLYLRDATGETIYSDIAASGSKRYMFDKREFIAAAGKSPYYVEVVTKSGSATTAATVRVLSDVLEFPAVPDGEPVTPTTTKWGQHVRVTFPAAAGQFVYFAADTPGATSANLYDPEGHSMRSDTAIGSGRRKAFEPMTASIGGTYTIELWLPPDQLVTSAFRVFSDVPTAVAPADGSTVAVTGTKWGQLTRITVPAAAGQVFYASVRGDIHRLWDLTGPGGRIEGHNEQDRTWTNMFSPRVLTETGTYTLEISPQFADNQTSSARVFTSAESADTAVDGAPVTLVLPAGGKQAVVRFDGVAKQKVVFSGSVPYLTDYELRDPSGNRIGGATATVQNGPFTSATYTLPATGRYELWLAPRPYDTTTAQLSLRVFAAP